MPHLCSSTCAVWERVTTWVDIALDSPTTIVSAYVLVCWHHKVGVQDWGSMQRAGKPIKAYHSGKEIRRTYTSPIEGHRFCLCSSCLFFKSRINSGPLFSRGHLYERKVMSCQSNHVSCLSIQFLVSLESFTMARRIQSALFWPVLS